MGKILNFQELKNKKNKKKYIVHIILGFIIFYIFLSIYWLVKTPSDTIMVDTGTLTLEESSTGYILREETVLKGENFKNGLTPIVAEGERAAKGQTVFRYNGIEEEATKEKIEEINSKIQETLANQPNLFTTTDIKILEKQIDEKTQNLKNLTDISTINEYKKQIMEIIDKEAKIAGSQSRSGAYIQQLTKEKEEYENKLTEDSEYITAPISGVVSYRVDGYEDILNVEDFSTITKNALNNLDLKTDKKFEDAELNFRDDAFKKSRYAVFAEDDSFKYFTFREYMEYVSRAYGVKMQDVADMVRGFHFEEFENTLLKDLSTGNRKKAFLITAFALRPKLLLLDEPVNGLDFQSTEYLYGLIAGYKEYGTLLFSSHILESITLTSDRVLVLENGAIAQKFEGEEITAESVREALRYEDAV